MSAVGVCKRWSWWCISFTDVPRPPRWNSRVRSHFNLWFPVGIRWRIVVSWKETISQSTGGSVTVLDFIDHHMHVFVFGMVSALRLFYDSFIRVSEDVIRCWSSQTHRSLGDYPFTRSDISIPFTSQLHFVLMCCTFLHMRLIKVALSCGGHLNLSFDDSWWVRWAQ